MQALVFEVTVEKTVRSDVPEEHMQKEVKVIEDTVKNKNTFKFMTKLKHFVIKNSGDNNKQYLAVINIGKKKYRNPEAVRSQFDKVKIQVERACHKNNWRFIGEGNYIDKPLPPITSITTSLPLPELTDKVIKKHFSRLFGRDPHIRMVYASLRQAYETNFIERNNILLRGQAGAAKSELFQCFSDWLGPSHVLKLDSTTVTKAGLQRLLLEKAQEHTLEPVVWLEEIEKVTEEKSINCLLQVASFGRIQRTQAYTGDEWAEAKVLLWATCNDYKKLKSFADGAIWSRFGTRIFCHRPDKDIMLKILMRTIEETGGDPRWTDKVIEFLWDKVRLLPEYREDYNDPRLAKALLCGRERIMDGTYFHDWLQTCQETDGDDVYLSEKA